MQIGPLALEQIPLLPVRKQGNFGESGPSCRLILGTPSLKGAALFGVCVCVCVCVVGELSETDGQLSACTAKGRNRRQGDL